MSNQVALQIAQVAEHVGSSDKREEVDCPVCGSSRIYRAFRQGLLQTKIYPMFGYYPWGCKTCGSRVILRKRGVRKYHHEAAE